jgi:hypothetical protein
MLLGTSLEHYVRYLYDAVRDPDVVEWSRLAARCAAEPGVSP